jgi:hypothetical protein
LPCPALWPCSYDGGFEPSQPYVVAFWDFITHLELDDKKKFLRPVFTVVDDVAP